MLKKLKKYLVSKDSEAFAVSLVDAPAIEEDFVYFRKDEGEKLEVALESDEKHMVYGAVLVPGKPIYRRNKKTNEEYFVEFTAESIEKMSQDYLKNFRQFNVTIQHETETPEVCMVESWLKSDIQYDKSTVLGLNPDLPVGTWFIGMRVNNFDTWERIKSGELRGFSVESIISLEELDFSKVEEKMEAQPVQEQPENTITSEPETPENVEVVEEPIEEVKEPEMTQEETKTETQEEPKPEPVVEDAKPSPLEELIKNLQSELDELKKTNSDLVEKVKDLSQLPSAKPINTVAGGNTGGDNYSAWREQMAKYL